jgi:hypothetical protein
MSSKYIDNNLCAITEGAKDLELKFISCSLDIILIHTFLKSFAAAW